MHSDYENICSIEKDDCEISGEFCSAVKGGKCVADGFCCKHGKKNINYSTYIVKNKLIIFFFKLQINVCLIQNVRKKS